jgi:threonine dehydrogenase-like Zn-dependent dehydrogenase
MKALTWRGKRDGRVETVPDPRLEQSPDAIVRITSTAICGSDLHLYELLGHFWKRATFSDIRWAPSKK